MIQKKEPLSRTSPPRSLRRLGFGLDVCGLSLDRQDPLPFFLPEFVKTTPVVRDWFKRGPACPLEFLFPFLFFSTPVFLRFETMASPPMRH